MQNYSTHDIKARLQNYISISRDESTDDTVQVLTAFYDFLPAQGKINLVEDIWQCGTDTQLRELSTSLVEGLLWPMMARGKTPQVTPSPREDTDSIGNLSSIMATSVSRRDQASLKKTCLIRDGYKCIISGEFDYNHKTETSPLHEGEITECAHIIPFSFFQICSSKEALALTNSWITLFKYFPSLKGIFSHSNIDDTSNAMTLSSHLHGDFTTFHFALEPTDTDHVYALVNHRATRSSKRSFPQDGRVSFLQCDRTYALPSPRLLEVHAVVARILHATGKGSEAEKLMRDAEEIEILAGNGSTDKGPILSLAGLSSQTSPSPAKKGDS